MSATDKHNRLEGGSTAHVNFRVRGEKLGHGEEVFLVQQDDAGMRKMVPLYTTATAHPWYHTLQPISLSLPPKGNGECEPLFRYRFVIHRAGVFHRFEDPSDSSEIDQEDEAVGDVDMNSDGLQYHKVPLRLLADRESYVINDVLGKTNGPPDIDHIRVQTSTGLKSSVTLLHSKQGARDNYSSISLASSKGSGSHLNQRKKAVGFAPAPPPYHQAKAAAQVQAVHLNSSDGLVVVSAFLPVILHRSDGGEWSADWDYEILLSMQTHLRVTRVGVVKWRGWHLDGGAQQEGDQHGQTQELLDATPMAKGRACHPSPRTLHLSGLQGRQQGHGELHHCL
jgi:hypothetical protein